MNAPILSFQQLTFAYPTNTEPTLSKFSLDIAEGSITAILGPNGAGKTTLLSLALGVFKPAAGEVRLSGTRLREYSKNEVAKNIGLVAQTETAAFDFSLLEFALLGRAPHLGPLEMPGESDADIAKQALARVGFVDDIHRSVRQLSGGEFQLATIARVLVQEPRILLLDEPMSHLDLRNKKRLVDLLSELAREGFTVLLTTHDPDIAAILADTIVLMRNGQVLASGKTDQMFTSRLLSEVYDLPISVENLRGRKAIIWN
ncbi:MAG: ABC transporter ATP-binding protein [Candidatus Ozemobacteraceae bacterium]